MPEKPAADQVFRPCGRAFFVYYAALGLCVLALLNPQPWLPPWLAVVAGVALAAAVIYFKQGQEYRVTAKGLVKIWRWPDRRQEISWENLGEVRVLRGLTQSLLLVGNLLIKSKAGGQEMFWFGLANPKEVQALIEGRRP
jgi:hypothetical protein